MRGAERSCRGRGNYSHLYKYFWRQGEPDQKCARKHVFERLGISWRLECVGTGAENTRDRVTRPSWHRRKNLLSDTHGGQEGLCWKPVLRSFLPNPITATQTWSWCVPEGLRTIASARSSLRVDGLGVAYWSGRRMPTKHAVRWGW